MVLTDFLTSIANAIRYAEKSSGKIEASDFEARIKALSGSQPIPPEPTPIRPSVPSGTWQLKTTTDKKYVIMGTDDDNIGNAKYFRLLRSYGFPYTMNVEAENLTHSLGNDVDASFFTDSDAPSLFPSGVDVVTLGKYLYDNNLGEVAQHGASANVLWDSSRLNGTFLDGLYDTYTSQGGTKTKEELKSAIIEELADSDVQNDAPYVAEARTQIEDTMGFYVNTVGLWGGSPTATVDGIELNLNSIKGGTYDWQGHNYWGASTRIAEWHINDGIYDIARMNDGSTDMTTYIDKLPKGKAVEFFWHVPFNDRNNIREMMESIKARVDDGEVEVVTRYQYSQLGEYVDNPIASISVTRNGSLSVGDTDTDSAYTITVTYADGTSGSPMSDVILDRSAVDTSADGTYTAYAYYRGFKAETSVVVMASGTSYPSDLKSTAWWFVFNNTSQNAMYCGNADKEIIEAKNSSGLLLFTTISGAILNGWKSIDGGATWTQVTTNRITYNGTVGTNTTNDSDDKYAFNSAWGNKISLVESSGNFEWNY